uniref:Cna B-type domain-containing protein n=1 Tax=Streptococcus castoreus TaxID=254786 RepID=UPI000481AE9C
VTLTAATDWKHTFKDLPKYDEKDGHEITYTISEVKVDGYTTGISGTAKDGFTITNTITGKVSVPVTKRWVGEAGDSVTVNLYADGKKIATQKLSKANNWQYTFGDLPQYKDGKEIIYTVEEEKISGYTVTVTGDAKNGFVITNTKDIPNKPSTPKHNLPKSGDEGNLSMYVGLVLVSAGLLLLLGIRRRKNGK